MTSSPGDPRAALDAGGVDELFERGAEAVLGGRHRRELLPPDESRWGTSVVLRLPEVAVRVLAGWTHELEVPAGPGHVATGSRGVSHLTVRALEERREAVDARDPFVRRCAAAVERVAARTPTVRLAVTGVTLAPGSVMAQVEPLDGVAWQLARDLERELGDDGHLEHGRPRDFFYATLLHFAGDVRDPAGLVTWVRERRRVPPVPFTVGQVDVVRYAFDAEVPVMRPHTLATSRLSEGRTVTG